MQIDKRETKFSVNKGKRHSRLLVHPVNFIKYANMKGVNECLDSIYHFNIYHHSGGT